MKKDLTVEKITDGTLHYNNSDSIEISVNDLDSTAIEKVYDAWNSLSPSGQLSSWSNLNSSPYIYTTTRTDTATMEDIHRLEEKLDDKLADMDGRLDVLLTDCVFSSDLAAVHSQIADLLNENNLLQNRINDLTKENNNLSSELLNIKETVNYLLNTISTLQQ